MVTNKLASYKGNTDFEINCSFIKLDKDSIVDSLQIKIDSKNYYSTSKIKVSINNRCNKKLNFNINAYLFSRDSVTMISPNNLFFQGGLKWSKGGVTILPYETKIAANKLNKLNSNFQVPDKCLLQISIDIYEGLKKIGVYTIYLPIKYVRNGYVSL